MKRSWLALFLPMLLLFFHTPSFAADVKFTGSYYITGMYLDKTGLKKGASDNSGAAFYFQRLRLQTDFIISPGLALITRFDIMERAWGAPRSAPSAAPDLVSPSAGTLAENENIAGDWAYISYASPLGLLNIGYQNDGAWGTVFGDTSKPNPKLSWILTAGQWMFLVQTIKIAENNATAKNPISAVDLDYDKIVVACTYYRSGSEAGVLGYMGRNAANRQGAAPPASMQKFYGLLPYIIFQIGPVKVQAEVDYYWGKYPANESGAGDVDLSNLAGFFDITADFGMFYAGGTFAYLAGDNPDTTDKMEGGLATGGRDWDPCLLLWNQDRTYWAGAIAGSGAAANSGPMSNAWFYQVRGGVRPIAALDIMASISYATADKKPAGFLNSTYGWEVDVTATYKITNNLSYMLGVGYLFTGDYFQGVSATNEVRDDYLIVNKLTLTF
jgi:hypothetical protein